jgi:hypothetical protein
MFAMHQMEWSQQTEAKPYNRLLPGLTIILQQVDLHQSNYLPQN